MRKQSGRMTCFALFTLVAASFPAATASAGSRSTDEAAIRQTVQDLLDSWREANAAKGDAAMHPDFRLFSRRTAYDGSDPALQGVAPHVGLSTRADMMAIYANLKPGQWDDRLSNVRIHWDSSGVGTLWANYRFHMGGKLTHCGAVAFTLYKMSRRWQIAAFADTHHWAVAGEPAGCAPPRA